MLAKTARLVQAVSLWPVRSVEGSRRNALVASATLADRRREREDVEAFLTGLGAAPAGQAPLEAAVGRV